MATKKSMALMMRSPNSSWINSLSVVPHMLTISYQRQISGSVGTRVGNESF